MSEKTQVRINVTIAIVLMLTALLLTTYELVNQVFMLDYDMLDYDSQPDIYMVKIGYPYGYNRVFFGQWFVSVYWQGNKVFQVGLEPIMG